MRAQPKIRRRKNKTNYLKRKRLLESAKPRVVIRKSNKYILIQYVESQVAKDCVKVSILSKDLLEYGWPKNNEGSLKSLPAAYLSGLLFGEKVKSFKPAILDTGLIRSTKGSRIYAALKGIVDSGFKIPHGAEIFPHENRIKNKNVAEFFDKVKTKIMGAKA